MSSARRIVAGALGAASALGLAAALAWWSLRAADDRSVRNVASPLLACPASRVEVVDRSDGDSADWYRVRGCGRTATLICSAPDFECFVSP